MMDHTLCVFARNKKFRPSQEHLPFGKAPPTPAPRKADKAELGTRK